MTAFIYILASQRNGTLYVGVTTDFAKRLPDHKNGVGSNFTAKYYITQLVHSGIFEHLMDASARERTLKHWRRFCKLELMEKDNSQLRDLSDDLF